MTKPLIDSQDSPASPSKARYRLPILLCFWIGLIFGTSCTVIRPAEFFKIVATFTGAGPETMEQFAMFWAVVWFTVVKGWHVAEFFILTLLCAAGLKWWSGQQTKANIGAAMLFCIAFAASDEWHQSFIPDRFGTVQDVLIDTLGVCLAGAILLLKHHRSAREIHGEPVSKQPA